MSLSAITCHIRGLTAAAVLAVGACGAAFAEQAGHTGGYDWRAMIPDGCALTGYDRTQSPADAMQAWATELGLTGQQQQDLQILTADYGERLRDLAKLMSESASKLMGTEPGSPDYWPLAQEVSAFAASSSAETVILVSEMREKFSMVLTADQRAELKRRIEVHKAQCKPLDKNESHSSK